MTVREQLKDQVLKEVHKIRKRQPRVGTKKLHKMVGFPIGRDRLHEVLRSAELLIYPKRSYRKTTNSRHGFKVYHNRIKNLLPDSPNQQYVSDITYLDIEEGFCYLSLMTDRYSRKIVGHACLTHLGLEGPLQAAEKALKDCPQPKGLIHHSDRGLQYASKPYVSLLEKNNIEISMTEEDHVYENALAERVNGILKQEFLLSSRFRSFEEAKRAADEAVQIYNTERLHSAIGYVTPEQKHQEKCQLF